MLSKFLSNTALNVKHHIRPHMTRYSPHSLSSSKRCTKCSYSTCPAGMKVTICGAGGCTDPGLRYGRRVVAALMLSVRLRRFDYRIVYFPKAQRAIGFQKTQMQGGHDSSAPLYLRMSHPLALLLKQCPLLDEIALYDICATCGYGMELSHVDTKCKVSSFSGRHMLCDALKGSKVVVIIARNECDSFENNAPVITEIALQICNTCHDAVTIVATEPIESMVPIVSEIQRLRGVYNPRLLLGCVELNCVRANTVLADFLRIPPETVRVPVIGGATPQTMVPVLSSAVHPCTLTQEQTECVTSSIMSGNEAVCAAKGSCTATACLAGAYAVARNTINVVKGLQGRKNVVQCAYVDSLGTCAPCCQFFASEVVLGPSGVERNLGIPELSKFENCLLCNCLPNVRNEIARAIWLVYTMCQQCCCSTCVTHPCTCFTPPIVPCVPPSNWNFECPDSCRDAHLASVCREMTCQCGSTDLCWRPREADYDAARAANVAHQMPLKGPSCNVYKVPKSVRIEQVLRSTMKNLSK